MSAVAQPWRPRRPALCAGYPAEQWPREDWPRDANAMRAAGVALVSVGAHAWWRLQPAQGRFDFDWLDELLKVMHAAGLRVVMCTPTQHPPAWLLAQYPELRSAPGYAHIGLRREARRVASVLGQRYGEHPAVVAWQLDDEPGRRGGVRGGPAAAKGFRQWLRERHGDIESLNETWGTHFHARNFDSFDTIEPPDDYACIAHRLEFARYSASQVLAFQTVQSQELRRLSPGRALLLNFAPDVVEFDQRRIAAELDIAAWTARPVTGAPTQTTLSRRLGDPDLHAFRHDLYRGSARLWALLQPPGGEHALPFPGALRLRCLEALAHGAEVVGFSRWRGAPVEGSGEHAGLVGPDGKVRTHDAASGDAGAADGSVSLDLDGQAVVRRRADPLLELRALDRDLKALRWRNDAPVQAPVALVYDWRQCWCGAEIDSYERHVLTLYRALRKLGVDIDVVGPESPLDGYRLLLAAGLTRMDAAILRALSEFGGELVVGPRFAARDPLARPLPQRPPAELVGLEVTGDDWFVDGSVEPLTYAGRRVAARTVREQVVPQEAECEARFDDGWGALWRNGRVQYLACEPDDAFADALAAAWLERAEVPFIALPEGVRSRSRGGRRAFFNFSGVAVDLPPSLANAEFVLGGHRLPPGGIAAIADA